MVFQQEALPSYQEMSRKFDRAGKLPEKTPVSFSETQKRRILNLISRLKDKILGLSSVSEYNTGKNVLWSRAGEKRQYDHIKDGRKTSTTTTLSTQNRLKGRLNFQEMTSTDHYDTDSKTIQQHTFKSEHVHVDNTGIHQDIKTESISTPDGMEYSKTQDVRTGETIFREEKEGIRKEWTFDKNKRLIGSYEAYFQNEEWKGKTIEKKYNYTKTGVLKSIQEKETQVTPDGEKVFQKTDILGDGGNELPQGISSLLSRVSHPIRPDNLEKTPSKEKILTAKLIQKIQDKARR